MFEADEATEREAKVADWACVSWSLWHSSVVWGLKGAERDAVADESYAHPPFFLPPLYFLLCMRAR